jgi:hypothetical protein
MSTPKFYTANGRLTAYAFACGYLETDGPFKLYREHGVYHVVGFAPIGGARIWRSARTLREGRETLRDVGNAYGVLPIDRGACAPRAEVTK